MTTSFSLKALVCDMLGIQYRIFGFNHGIDVIGEVCKAGGIRIYEHSAELLTECGFTPDEVRGLISAGAAGHQQGPA